MVKILILIFIPLLLLSKETLSKECDRCHLQKISYAMIYKRALLIYSSKNRIEKYLIDFLQNPDSTQSIMPPGIKMHFTNIKHPSYSREIAQKAAKELIEQEDIIKKFR